MEATVQEHVTAPEGAAGEPAKPVAAGSPEVNLDELVDSLKPSEPQAAKGAPAIDEELAKKLEGLDPESLPEGLRRKLESPFLSNYTKKTTDWDNERQRLLGMIEKLSSRPDVSGQEPPEDQREALRQKIADGDLNALEQFVDQRFSSKYGAKIEQIDLNNAYRQALTLYPDAGKMEPEIADTLKSNPGVAFVIRSVVQRDPALAGTLIAGVAKNIAYDKLATEHEKLKASRKDDIKAGIEAYKKAIAGLPSSSFKGGSTPPKGSAPGNLTLRQSLEAAYSEHYQE